MAAHPEKLLVKGGLVYDHDGDVHRPPVADVLVEGADIAAVGPELPAERTEGAAVLDAAGHLVLPGLINGHYHSHDTLCRGLFEEMPLELWLLYALPMGGNRSKEEVRLRTLVGALESMRCGITTVQDMLGLIPLTEEYVDVVLSAYEEIGERVVFAPMVADVPPVGMLHNRDLLPPEVQAMLGDTALGVREQLDFLESQFKRRPPGGVLHWAMGPFAPQRCTPEMLAGCGDLAARYDLGVYIHVYETRPQAAMAREAYGGSFIDYLATAGILDRRLNIAHSVWITRREMDRMAAADAGVVLNHNSNMKLKSGIAPVLDLQDAGVRIALGCDNCSGSDVQNMFQAMKLFCLLCAVSDPELGPPRAAHALRLATLGGARSAMLDDRLGAIRPGRKADLVLLDMRDTAWLPYNSAARQLVYTETGRSIAHVVIDGRVVIRDRAVQTIDEEALRREVSGLMRHVIADYDEVVKTRQAATAYIVDANRRAWGADVGLERFIARTLGEA